MKATILSQEIILVTTTSFSHKQFSEKNPQADGPLYSASEMLEKACWDGLLNEMLPGIVDPSDNLFIWQVRNGSSFLKIDMGVCMPAIKNRFTLDPHYFLCDKEMN
jgi:hypothetical protein